mgnify:CR=1 FL=1
MYTENISSNFSKRSVKLISVLAGVYYLIVFPFHFLCTVWLLLYHDHPFYGIQAQEVPAALATGLLLLVALALFIIVVKRRKQNINHITRYYKSARINKPFSGYVVKTLTRSKYMGLDTRAGTVLFISHPGVSLIDFFYPTHVQIKLLGLSDIISMEIKDNRLQIYTGVQAFPCVEITGMRARLLYEKINFMKGDTEVFEELDPDFVRLHAERVTKENRLNLI